MFQFRVPRLISFWVVTGMYLRAGSRRIPPATLNKFSASFCPETKIFYPEYEILNNIDLVSWYQQAVKIKSLSAWAIIGAVSVRESVFNNKIYINNRPIDAAIS